ncbi:unnamed protein product [Urochloa decumbens]|uniref:RING-type domain-containing protein n=1 Tax=Urochloa decumbens TaxID=240449 RepID=A0ABC8WKM5_9POAL
MDDDAERRRELEELKSRIDELTELHRQLKEIEDEAQMHERDEGKLAVAGGTVSYDDIAAGSLLQHRDPVPMASGEYQYPDHLYRPLLNSPFDEPEEDDAMQIELGYQENDYDYQELITPDGTGHLHPEARETAVSGDQGDHYILPDPALCDDDVIFTGEATPARFSDGGFGGVPASAAAIRALKKQRFGGSGAGADSMCIICMRDYKKKGKRLYVMPCAYKHRFHRKCLKKWLSRSHLCPLCRQALPTCHYIRSRSW